MEELDKHINSHTPTKTQKIFRIILPVIILILAFIISGEVAKKKQKPKKQPPKKMTLLVESTNIIKQNEKLIIKGMGTVIPAKQVSVYPKISGNIINISQNFIEGKILKKDEIILEIDSKDYELQLKIDEAKLIQANALLEIEKGKQEIAKEEWEMIKLHKNFDENKDNSLALRKPQLNQVQSDIETAKVNVEKSKLNIERTKIFMPFDGIILKKYSDLSSLISPQTKLCDIVYANEFYLEGLIPVSKLKWIDFPNSNNSNGSIANIAINNDESFQFKGEVIQLLKEIESNGRLAKILISIKNPINIEKITESILLNSYVNFEIEGKTLDGVFKIPREALRENNTIWEISSDSKLKIIKVNVLFKDKNVVYIEAIKPSIEIILTDISLPIDGMPVSRFEKISSDNNVKENIDENK